MARKVSAAVLAVEELNVRMDKFTPMLTAMVQSLSRQSMATEKMLELQIEQTETMRRREEIERVEPKVKDDKGKEVPVKAEKKKDEKKKGNSLNFIGGIGGIMGKVALGGLITSFAALQMFEPIKQFIKDVVSGFAGTLWDNIKESLPKWIRSSMEGVPENVKEKAGDVGSSSATGAGIGFMGGKLIKFFSGIPKLGRIGTLAGGIGGALNEFGMNPTAAFGTGGGIAGAVLARKQIVQLMPEAIKKVLGSGWNVAKGTAGAVASGAAKITPPAAAAAGAGAAKGGSWLAKRLPAIGKGAATVGKTIAPLLKWGPQTFLTAMTATDSRDGIQELTPEQRDYLDNTSRSKMEQDIMKDWANSVASTGVTPNLYTYHNTMLQDENKNREEPWTEQEIHERVMRLAEESLKIIPNAIIKAPKDIPGPPAPKKDEPMRITIPPAQTSKNSSETKTYRESNSSESGTYRESKSSESGTYQESNSSETRAYQESRTQEKRERRLSETTEKKASKPSVVALKGGDSHTKQGDKINNVTNNYYSSVDPSKNLDPYRMGWA